jgi:hypothetical protein
MASIINASSTGSGGLISTGDASGVLQLQANGVTQATVSSSGMTTVGTVNAPNTFGFKNRFINGQMAIWQRATSGTASGSTYFGPDRWLDGGQTYPFSQSTDVPTNSPARYSLEINASAGSYGTFGQRIESYNVQDMAGQTVTFSFYAKLVSGGGGLNINISTPNSQDNYSASTGVATSTPTITSSWAQYVVTFVAPASITNGIQINLFTNSQAAQIRYTLFQFEIGSQATSFDVRSIGTEFALCQRYYELNYPYGTYPGNVGTDNSPNTIAFYANNGSISAMGGAVYWKVPKRATPSVTIYSSGSGGSSTAGYVHPSGGSDITGVVSNIGTNNSFIYAGSFNFYFNWTASAEL